MLRVRTALFAAAAFGLVALAAPTAHAGPPPAWPVRLNLALPLGYTFGNDRVHGFTWGLRAAAEVYPTAKGRGVGFGPYGEVLLDAETHSLWTLGGSVNAPAAKWDWVDWRVGALAGWTTRGEPGAPAAMTFGALTSVNLPVYLYDFRVGVRLVGVFSDGKVTAASLLCDLDLIGLIGAVGSAYGMK